MKNKLEEAKKLLQEEQEKKVKACAEEVNQILAKHDMTINAIILDTLYSSTSLTTRYK